MLLLNKSRKRPSNSPVIILTSCHERLSNFVKYFVYWNICIWYRMLNSTHNLSGLQLGDIDRRNWIKFHTGGGGEGGRLRPEVQPLTLLYTSFDRKSTHFESHFVNITNDTPCTYWKLSCVFHSYKIHLLGPSADRNDRFPYLIL